MIDVLHISAECYPAAKAGGLGDVVGALPKYQTKTGLLSAAIIPKYHTRWVMAQDWVTVYSGVFRMHDYYVPFSIEQEATNQLGFPLFVANIPGRFDRPGIYANPDGGWYQDEVERFLSFQLAVLSWLEQWKDGPKLLHCHDHHTGLIPFMVKHTVEYGHMADTPTVFTIHNGEYHGSFSWRKMNLLPYFHENSKGYLDWSRTICPLATGIKCAWKLTTVSPSYLNELRQDSNGLEGLIRSEAPKSHGVLNGIDNEVWDPRTDKYLSHHMKTDDVDTFKQENREILLRRFNINPEWPIITFIGRLVKEKGADILPDLIARYLYHGGQANFLILGTGDPQLMARFEHMRHYLHGRFDAALEYNEGLARLLYAGSDYLFMPSRVEPCGLNQMYAFRYGTVPIARAIGGLRDTVIDMGEPDGTGRGIRFMNFNLEDMYHALDRAVYTFHQKDDFRALRKKITELDFSWERSATEYINIYKQLTNFER